MQFKDNTKQRSKTIQGLRSFKDTLPKNVKKIINKKGHIYSETLSNWKYIVGEDLFKVCYPKTFKNANKFGVSTLLIMVKRGHEVDMEYSKKDIMDKMNSFFGYTVVEKLKFISFDDEQKIFTKKETKQENVAINKYQDKINNVNETGNSQNEILFILGNAISGAPIIIGTNQFPNPPIIAGITIKKIMIKPCPVTKTLYK